MIILITKKNQLETRIWSRIGHNWSYCVILIHLNRIDSLDYSKSDYSDCIFDPLKKNGILCCMFLYVTIYEWSCFVSDLLF